MYDIRQFRPTLYLLLLLVFTGYAVAAQAPGLWLLSVGATVLHMYLCKHEMFRPLPRLVANGLTLLFAAWLVMRVRTVSGPPILAICEFLVFLQLVKLYEERGNRDLAQLLVLSLLLMVAAAISTGTLVFALLFIVYLFLSLYCCLLFHLKTETDHAKAVMGITPEEANVMTLKQDQRFLPRSMRRLTLFVSGVSIVMAVAVFLFFPRGSGAGIIGNLAFKPNQAMTGFSDQVSFQDVARITQNETPVASVNVTKDGATWGALGKPLYLRGSAPDSYVSNPNDPDRWKWRRTTQAQTDLIPHIGAGTEQSLNTPFGGERLVQQVHLYPTGTPVLFAMPGLVSFMPGRDVQQFTHGRTDDVIQLREALTGDFNYTVVSTGQSEGPPPPAAAAPPPPQSPRSRFSRWLRSGPGAGAGGAGNNAADFAGDGGEGGNDRVRPYPVPKEVTEFALRDEVAGVDARGNLARQRLAANGISDLDEQVARNIERYLQTQFTYTLDLTDARRVANKDPMVQFLYDFKKGHCEYFAGAMTLMCQGLKMNARMVVGFKCDDFNNVGGYYQVKQSHAHAWVEVLTKNGWQMFDPTAARESDGGSKAPGVWKQFTNLLSYLEYTWGDKVVNYDSESRSNLIQNVDSGLTNTAVQTSGWLERMKRALNLENFFYVSSGLISLIITAAVTVVAISLGYFLYERLRLRRRARRIGIDLLPTGDQMRLARQLAFYDALLQSLDRHDVVRHRHHTPMEFAHSVGFLPGDLYTSIL
ncbi:MAG TPA: DUF3488 and transglutaminase-like domain-containing protein, partial [Tepidisphaeraceae bacterium]